MPSTRRQAASPVLCRALGPSGRLGLAVAAIRLHVSLVSLDGPLAASRTQAIGGPNSRRPDKRSRVVQPPNGLNSTVGMALLRRAANLLHKDVITLTELDDYFVGKLKTPTRGHRHPVMARRGDAPDFPIAIVNRKAGHERIEVKPMRQPITPNAGRFLSLIFCLAFAAHGSVAAEPDGPICEGLAKASAQAGGAKDLGRLEKLLNEEKEADSQCSERTIFCLGRNVALGYLEQAYSRADAGAPPEELDKLLTKGRSFGAPWQLLTLQGDLLLHRAQKAHDGALFGQASSAYQQALIELQDEPACKDFGEPPRPSKEEAEHLYRNMSATLLLAEPLKIERTRCSPCNWAFFSRIGDFEPHSRPLPLTFKADKDELTPEGNDAAAELIECLRVERPSRIVLSGHTDLVGTDAYNRDLSQRRLDAVKDLLVKSGFTGAIELQAKGKSEPFSPPDAGYSAEEVRKLNRRIELVSYFDAAPACAAPQQP